MAQAREPDPRGAPGRIDPQSLPDFADIAGLIRQHALQAPAHEALIEGGRRLDYAALVRRPGHDAIDGDALLQWTHARPGKTQRLHALRLIDELPRSPIGKVLKRELRELFGRG